jgi:hypothetical protein
MAVLATVARRVMHCDEGPVVSQIQSAILISASGSTESTSHSFEEGESKITDNSIIDFHNKKFITHPV